MHDITNNPDVIKLTRELDRIGVKASFYKVNDRYGFIVAVLRPALDKHVEEFNAKWNAVTANATYDAEHSTVVYNLKFLSNFTLDTYRMKEIENFFLKHGVLALVAQPTPDSLTLVLHMKTYAKHVEKKVRAQLTNANAYFQYLGDKQALVVHMWTGTTPADVKKIKEAEEKG